MSVDAAEAWSSTGEEFNQEYQTAEKWNSETWPDFREATWKTQIGKKAEEMKTA